MMNFRNFASTTNGGSNGFTGMHAAASTAVPAHAPGTMLTNLTTADGTNMGTIMSSFWQQLSANGSTDATAPLVGTGLGPMMGNLAGDSALGIGPMGGLYQEVHHAALDPSTTASTLPQWMLDHMPGISLVGMPHLNLDFLSSAP